VNVIEFLHSKNIVHRDIKPDNIFIQLNNDLEYGIKLIDFGSACSTNICKDLIGTFLYSAPEILKLAMEDKIYSEFDIEDVKKHDLWSLGLVIYNCVHNGKNPTDYYNFYSDMAKDYYNFYTKYEGIPAVTYFGKINHMNRKKIKYEIEMKNFKFLDLLNPELKTRLNYKNYLKINSKDRKILRMNQQQLINDEIYKRSLILEKESEEIFTRLRQKRQEQYKKKTDELSALRVFWRKNPNWNEFLEIQSQKFKIPKDQIFLFLIHNPNNIDIFWNDMMKSTKARRQSFLYKLFKKMTKNKSQDFRLPQTSQTKNKIFSLKNQ
jgi:serine/threonine protein kinase